MRALVTGATGFTGQALVRRLIEQGDQAVALVRTRQRSGPDPVAALRSLGAEIVEGTVFDAPVLAAAIAKADVVFHVAWQWHRPDVPGAPPAGDAAEQWHVNVEGTHALIAAAQRAGVGRLVFTGTVAVYPNDLPSPVAEAGPTFTPDSLHRHPVENYVAPKLAVEEMIRHLLPPAAYVILRPAMIYGVGAQWAPGMVRGALQGPPRRMVQPVNWIHVDDLARAMILAAAAAEAGGTILNIAGHETVGSDQLREAIQFLANRPAGGGEPAFHLLTPRYETALARRLLGFEAAIGLAQGLAQMVAAVLAQGLPAAPPQPPRPQWGQGGRPAGFWRAR